MDNENAETEKNDKQFYIKTDTTNGVKVEIMTSKLLKFWESKGFRKLKLPKGGYQLIKLKNNCIINEAYDNELTIEVKKELLKEQECPDVWEEYLSSTFTSRSKLDGLEVIQEMNLNKNTRETAYFYFRNGVLKLTKDRRKIISYSDFDGYLFQDQIIQHDIDLNEQDCNSNFDLFLNNVCKNEQKRYNQLISSIGYLLHGYKDPTITKAVILVDEELDFSGEAHGGTGKSLIGRAIKEVTHTLMKDGKNLTNRGNRFFYQDINLSHRVLFLDDVLPSFNFEDFFSVVTGDMIVEEKYKASYRIPFEMSPKLLITSNYVIKGSGGNSDDRRRVEIEVHPHYKPNFTPQDEFGERLFDDWSAEQWNCFFNDMLGYCQHYLKYGIQKADPINLKENKLKMSTDYSFVEFADSNIKFTNKYQVVIKNKGLLYEAFRLKYHVEARNVSSIMFKKWIDKWADCRGLNTEHYKSNSDSLVKFTKK